MSSPGRVGGTTRTRSREPSSSSLKSSRLKRPGTRERRSNGSAPPRVVSPGNGTPMSTIEVASTEAQRPASEAESIQTEIAEQENPQHASQESGQFSPAPEVIDEEHSAEDDRKREGGEEQAKEAEVEVPQQRPESSASQVQEEPNLRPLSAYSEVVDPEDFDSRSFLSSISDLSVRLQTDQYRNIDEDFPADELSSMVSAVSNTLTNFQTYASYSQKQMEGLRDQMKTVKDRMHKRITQKAYDPGTVNERLGLEERELEAKLAQLNKELARTAEELARASAVSAETEAAAITAALVADRAAADAARIQADYETRRQVELEARQLEEERRQLEEQRQRLEAEKAEQARRAEEERRTRLKRGGEQSRRSPVWENWPVYSYPKKPGEFDQGVACMVRADPSLVKESWIRAEVISQLNSSFVYGENEELVSNLVCLHHLDEGEELPAPIHVAIPHCTSRVSAMTREPVIKAEIDGKWVELRTEEVSMEEKKDVKFVQAEVEQFTTLAVVTRFKRDYLQMSKRGGRETSTVDSRVTFMCQRGAFRRTENFVLQPIDTVSITEVKAQPEAQGLLCASSIVNMEWTSRGFDQSITMTLPCPPNPVKAKKAAAIRAAKEAKMKKPVPSPLELLEEARRREEQQQEKPEKPKNRWYMGQYSANDDDENDLIYLLTQEKTGKWVVMEGIDILQARLDLLQFELHMPLDRFVLLRTRCSVGIKDAQKMASLIENQLSQRLVTTVIKQRDDDLTDVALHVVPLPKLDRIVRKLSENGYDSGPGPSNNVYLKEGDLLEINFRGNITACEEDLTSMTLVYNSQLATSTDFYVREVDRFLQKNYSVYRGFVQVFKEVRKTRLPTKAEMDEGRTDPWVDVTKHLVTEQLITIPKEGPSSPTPRPILTKAPVIIRNVHDPINEETLRDVAAELGDEWRRVAHFLNVKRMRIQAIMRNCHDDEDTGLEDAKFEALMTWLKRVPRGVAKVPILCQALVRSGRGDLAERLTDLDKEFQEQRRAQ